ncbi:helix-turn-helix transcriptional regulator [Bauldia sp.]|uniref:helix-turn-helix transcriptional regulator n=1 Tax=Bauldia sp. TaxID=2575872 RepID=UPI003BA84F16
MTDRLQDAIAALSAAEGSAGAWTALPALSRLGESEVNIEIDFRASERVGLPVVIARERQAWPACFDRLTERQCQVAMCLVRGLSNKQIARELDISVATTKDHVHAILTRLGVDGRGRIAALVFGPEA